MKLDGETAPDADKASPSAEQAAELAVLEQAAGEGGAKPATVPAVAAGVGDQVAPPTSAALMLAAQLLVAARPLACMLAPGLKQAPEEMWDPLHPAVARILDHLKVADSEQAKSPWVGLGLALLPLAGVAVAFAPPKAKRGADQVEGGGEPARIGAANLAAVTDQVIPGSKTVVIGAPLPAGGAA